MTPSNVVSILIIQTVEEAVNNCKRGLSEIGLVEGKDFIVEDHPDKIRDHVVVGKKQLLITSSIQGARDEADRFVKEVKRNNANLKVLWFSIYPLTEAQMYAGLYDGQIKKVRGIPIEGLVAEVQKFLTDPIGPIRLPEGDGIIEY